MNPNDDRQNQNQPVMDVQRPSKPLFEAPGLPQEPIAPPPPKMTPPPTPNGKSRGSKKGLIAVIIIAVVITLLLVGAAAFVFLRSKKSGNTAQTTTSQSDQGDGKVDETDIDATTEQLDSSINSLNDSDDFNSDALSDKTIGL